MVHDDSQRIAGRLPPAATIRLASQERHPTPPSRFRSQLPEKRVALALGQPEVSKDDAAAPWQVPEQRERVTTARIAHHPQTGNTLAGMHRGAIAAPMDDAQARLEEVRGRIAHACAIAGSVAEDVTLVAVSKTHPAEAIEPLLAAGQRAFGENRVQEAAAKWPELRMRWPDVRLHLVGQLQSNKAAEAVALFGVIHSVDRPSLVDALAKAMAAKDRRPDCFVQVNLEDDTGKGGCALADLPALLKHTRDAGLPVIGLMCVPPLGLEPAPWFALLAKLADDHDLPARSMGMSGDYETAVKVGATHVRVGTALFGAR